MIKKINCKKCNCEIITTSNNRKFCISCKDILKKENNFLYRKENKIKLSEYHTKYYKKYHNNNKLNINFKKKVVARDLLRKDLKKNPHLYIKECCICGVTENIEFHHPNYDFAYSVYPLCVTHHKEIHKNLIGEI